MSEDPLVSAEEMASVLAEQDGPAVEDAEEPRTPSGPFTLRRPLVVPSESEPACKARLASIAGALAESLSHVLDSEIELDVHGFQQQQVCAAVDRLTGPVWLLGFRLPEGGGVVLGLDPTAALAVIELTLGGAGTFSADGREPTPLETRVMSNLTGVLAGSLRRKLGLELAAGFRVGSVSSRLAPPSEIAGSGLVRIRVAGGERNGLLLATSHFLRTPEGDDEEEDSEPAGASPIADRLLELPIEARPVLPVGTTTLRQLLALQPGTVLRFSVPETQSLDLRINGKTLFSGTIARQAKGAQFSVEHRAGSESAPAEPTAALAPTRGNSA